MELKELVRVLSKYKVKILVFSLALGVLGFLVSFYLPKSYRASAALYVRRGVEEPTKDFFTYEGFYSQQTSEKYTNTVVGFIESNDIRREALDKLGIMATPENLHRLERKIKVTKEAPQLINLEVRGSSSSEAEKIWEAMARATIERVNLLNQSGDRYISLGLVNPKPFVEVVKPNLMLNAIIANMFGLLVGISFFSFREYLNG